MPTNLFCKPYETRLVFVPVVGRILSGLHHRYCPDVNDQTPDVVAPCECVCGDCGQTTKTTEFVRASLAKRGERIECAYCRYDHDTEFL
jgi:hypothetical protein